MTISTSRAGWAMLILLLSFAVIAPVFDTVGPSSSPC